jgi:hypothetical protein
MGSRYIDVSIDEFDSPSVVFIKRNTYTNSTESNITLHLHREIDEPNYNVNIDDNVDKITILDETTEDEHSLFSFERESNVIERGNFDEMFLKFFKHTFLDYTEMLNGVDYNETYFYFGSSYRTIKRQYTKDNYDSFKYIFNIREDVYERFENMYSVIEQLEDNTVVEINGIYVYKDDKYCVESSI